MSIVRTTVPGLDHRTIITATLLVQMTCTRIMDPAMAAKSTWEVRAHALASDLAATVITSFPVPFMNTWVLATDTTSTWVTQVDALGQEDTAAAATTGTVQVTCTAAYATRADTRSALRAIAVG